MPGSILIDTGPLVALVDADEQHHQACLDVLEGLPRRVSVVTISPVLTEAFYLLADVPHGQDSLFELLVALQVTIAPLSVGHLARIRQLMKVYQDLPMDFADGALVAKAEESQLKTVFTLDRRDFQIYRPSHVKNFSLLP